MHLPLLVPPIIDRAALWRIDGPVTGEKLTHAKVGVSNHTADVADNEIVAPVQIRHMEQAVVMDDPTK